MFYGELKFYLGPNPTRGCDLCDGSILDAGDNPELAALIAFNPSLPQFALPNYQGRFLVGQKVGVDQIGGAEKITLAVNNLPVHTHRAGAQSGASTFPFPVGNILAVGTSPYTGLYSNNPANTALDMSAVSSVGGDLPHDNVPPFVGVNVLICTSGGKVPL